MRVKTSIVFEVEYPLDLNFYGTDERRAMEMEEGYVDLNPMEIIEAFEAKGEGTFETIVERTDETE